MIFDLRTYLFLKFNMPSKVPPWFSEYRKVSDRQQEYLRKIHDLRRSIQNRDEQLMMVAIERQRLLRGRRKNPKNPKMSSVLNIQINSGPQPFPNRQCEKKFYLCPTPVPRKLAPIIKGKQLMDARSETSEKDLDKESIDIIAKRNLNLSVIGQVSPNCSPSPKPFHKERQLLNMSRVSIREEDRSRRSLESFLSVPPAMEYITNVSTRKVVYSSGK